MRRLTIRRTVLPPGRGERRWRARGLAGAAALVLLGGCDSLLDVTDPSSVNEEDLNTVEALPVIRAGVISDFQTALGGSSSVNGLVLLSGLLGDELIDAQQDPLRQLIDQRSLSTDNLSFAVAQLYRQLQRARVAAEAASAKYASFDSTTSVNRAEMLALAGYAYVLLGETFCSGVPFSKLERTPVYGTPQTTTQIFTTAVAKFDSALAITSAGAQGNLASVGKGRALLDLHDPAGAGAAVAGVSPAFTYSIEFSGNSQAQWNATFFFIFNGLASVANVEGGVGLPYVLDGDARTPTLVTGTVGLDNSTPLTQQLKYGSLDADIVLASGTEASLISAEAVLRGGDAATWLATLNALRASAGLADTTDPGTDAGRLALTFRERSYWLW
ncbi:MAG: hypothetical protein ACRDLY_05725, partial [Thermoleophilaceae bacterium]